VSTNLSFARSVAENAIKRLAPDELPLFDEAWEDLSSDPENIGTLADVESAGGVDPGIVSWSTIVIPIVVAIVSHFINESVDSIFERLKKRRDKNRVAGSKSEPSDATLRETAEQIHKGQKDNAE
jgi:hypothetical protein